jgi:hypothetical protein
MDNKTMTYRRGDQTCTLACVRDGDDFAVIFNGATVHHMEEDEAQRYLCRWMRELRKKGWERV